MHLSDFDYDLPPDLIAQHPAPERTASRLLVVDADTLADRTFDALPDLTTAGDLLVFNDTRVIKARLLGRKASGGQVEVMVERVVAEREALALIRASHAPKDGSTLHFATAGATAGATAYATVVSKIDAGPHADHAPAAAPALAAAALPLYRLAFSEPVDALLERIGKLPLPPYITHAAESEDEARYQTVYASRPGAVAAPTAGLHFDDTLLQCLRDRGVTTAMLTLHVGAGTFLPVRTEDLSRHRMHSEWFDVPEATARKVKETRDRGGRIIAVGTTTLRALEASGGAAGPSDTDLFITPGYRFTVVDCLITNFHLPRSTLLMLVSAFAGTDIIRRAYAHAIERRYRFFSYGDAMMLRRASG
jgi:S-adenosylmethionine:tRNA ribosyltransferase-isomerase